MENAEVLEKEFKSESRLDHKFRYALNLTIDKYIHSVKFSSFREKYHLIHQEEKLNLQRIHHQLQKQLKSQMKTYTSALYTKYNISTLLSSFEKIVSLIQKSNSEQTVWAQTDSVIKVNPFTKEEYRDQLKLYLQKLSDENKEIENAMFQNHEEILDLKEHIYDLNKSVCELLDNLSDSSRSKKKKSRLKAS